VHDHDGCSPLETLSVASHITMFFALVFIDRVWAGRFADESRL
jgi:hypothetical protein